MPQVCTVNIVIPLQLSLTFKALSRSHEPSKSLATLTYPMQLYRRVNEAQSQLRYIAEILHLPNLVTFALACGNDMDCNYILRGTVKHVLQQSSEIGLHTIVLQQAPRYYMERNALHVTNNLVRWLAI